jgi:plastocyanin
MRAHVLTAPLLIITVFACRPADKPVAASSAAAPIPNVLTVVTEEYSFKLASSSIPAGLTTIRMVNAGKEFHHIQLYRLEDGKSFADFTSALQTGGPLPAWAVAAGGPNPSAPGLPEASATLRLEPGPYALVCYVPSSDGMPHVAKGMVASLDVVAEGEVAGDPTGDVEMVLTDYAFGLAAPMTAGPHEIHLVNQAEQPHEVVLVRLAEGATGMAFPEWAEGGMKGPPPATLIGGVSAIAKGQSASFPVDLAPGNYALICFVPDAKDGRPHFAHGMVQEFTIN